VVGEVSIIDQVVADDRADTLRRALSFVNQRHDIGVILVVDEHDDELMDIADEFGAGHPVDVFKWPDEHRPLIVYANAS